METFTDPKVPVIFQNLFESDKKIGKFLVGGILPQFAPFSSIQCLENNDIDEPFAPVLKLLCEDKNGEKRLVHIWSVWVETFRSKIIHYIKRTETPYPMHTICFANLIIDETSDAYCHRYRLTDSFVFKCSDGQDIIVVELPKFKFVDPQEPTELELWLSFLADINGDVQEAPQHLLDHPDTASALELIRFDAQSYETINECEAFLRYVERLKAVLAHAEADMVLLRKLYRI